LFRVLGSGCSGNGGVRLFEPLFQFPDAGIFGPEFVFHGFLALFETAEAVFD
jgi:hypothetical protein